ncbi:MAG: hypothetical protein M5U09_26705 [Gammaproteobacteria bacterium]|nr:hypothetical protein [Gammaproteobacteria bacterium]
MRIVRAGALVDSLSGEVFWRALAALILWAFALRCGGAAPASMAGALAVLEHACYLPVMPLHDRYPWYLFIPDLLDRGLLVVLAVAVWDWAVANHRADLRLRGWAARQRRRWPVLLRWQWRRGRRWWPGGAPGSGSCCSGPGSSSLRCRTLAALPMYEPLTRITDVDGLMKLRGSRRTRRCGPCSATSSATIPGRAHTFRPVSGGDALAGVASLGLPPLAVPALEPGLAAPHPPGASRTRPAAGPAGVGGLAGGGVAVGDADDGQQGGHRFGRHPS